MKKKANTNIYIFVMLVVAGIVAGALLIFVRGHNSNSLVINEVAFSHDSSPDWIELYNPTLNNISLKGMYLTDKAKNFSKFRIDEDIVIGAGEYLIIYGENAKDSVGDGYVITNFNLSDGETVYLIGRDGSSIVDEMTVVLEDDLGTDVSIGRFPDGSDDIFILTEYTPGSSNKHSDE